MVTYSHFTVPRWFALKGGWEKADAPGRFAKFCERATRSVGDMIGYATTLNEPDVAALLDWVSLPNGQTIGQTIRSRLPFIRKQLGAPDFSSFVFADGRLTLPNLVRAHIQGKEAIKSVRAGIPVGLSLAMSDDQPASSSSRVEEKRAAVYGPFLEAARKDDFFGVQTYTRAIVAEKDVPPPKDAELTQTGWEFYPEALEHTVRYAAQKTGVPIVVTENGIAKDDDERRVEYVRRALSGVQRCLDDHVDVRGYIRDTQMRTVKSSPVPHTWQHRAPQRAVTARPNAWRWECRRSAIGCTRQPWIVPAVPQGERLVKPVFMGHFMGSLRAFFLAQVARNYWFS